MRAILLKNPSTPNDPYDAKFKESGFSPVFVPLLIHTHSDKKATIDYLRCTEFVNEVKHFVITSQRAVEMLEECLIELDIQAKEQILTKVGYTVGPATFKVLQRIGFKDVRGGEKAGNGKVLAEFIRSELSTEVPIIFFTGEIRKDIIPRMLKNWGYNLQEQVIYKTENRGDIIETFETRANETIVGNNWIIFFSPQGTSSIVDYIKTRGELFRIASIGPTTEEYLIENGIKPDIVSPKPEASSLVSSILQHK